MKIDNTERLCSVCSKMFKLTDYAPGYFAYKKQVRKGSMANTCSSCEIGILERMADDQQNSERYRVECQEDIELLRTGKIATERHARQYKRVYG